MYGLSVIWENTESWGTQVLGRGLEASPGHQDSLNEVALQVNFVAPWFNL